MQVAILTLAVIGGSALTAQNEQIWRDCATASADSTLPDPECSVLLLPLRYEAGQDSISIAAMRMTQVQSTTQLWFLDGGPGDAGSASLPRLARVLDFPGVDFYTLDHRGVGGSALLRCPPQQAPNSPEGAEITREEWSGCIEHIGATRDDLDALTATNSAIDLSRAIEAFREPGKRVVIMGVSYGAYLAQRYLQLFPDQPDAVILDGIVPPDWSFAEFDRGLDTVARRVLAKCTENGECNQRLGPDPIETTVAMLDTLATGHCDGIGLTPQLTKLVLGSMLMVDAVPHVFLMGFIHRVRRCSWHDRLAVLHMFRDIFGDLSEPESHSQVLQRHVAMSELWPPSAVDSLEFEKALDNYVMTTEVSASLSRTATRWPVYSRPVRGDAFAVYDGPMLLLHGGLDPTMPLERLERLSVFYNGENQTFIVFPDAGHVVINESGCAKELYESFLGDPEAPLPIECVSRLPPLVLDTDSEQTKSIFGTDDLWGDSVGTFHWLGFASLFRFPAILIGLVVLFFGLVRRNDVSTGSPSFGRTIVFTFLWVAISSATWIAAFIAPLLMNYAPAVLAAVLLILMQLGIGWWVVKKISFRPAT